MEIVAITAAQEKFLQNCQPLIRENKFFSKKPCQFLSILVNTYKKTKTDHEFAISDCR